ncbi:unnamed protein product [Phytophthora fragariaefolia]|uniref:Unnamed protein product n=1 Tax=Phytophthora fragariaefolia TaxID=1490495 RepID=A0A9W6XNV0_9STRA|nr:unnamed protein product [Phytophthora fragariaefolia]
MPATPRSSKQRTYTIQQKRNAVLLASDIGTKPAADFLGYPPQTHVKFAIEFWGKHESSFTESTIFNVDETAIYYDTPPKHILAERGRKGSAKVKYTEKHSARLTAVLTVRVDGKKLPILFIVKGMPGGSIDKEELPKYPQGQGHVYWVQENGWMDSRVWSIYAKELLKFEIDAPSVLLADNFDYHVSGEGQEVIKRETNATASTACEQHGGLPAP